MARYDRIAPLSAPVRESAFPAWSVLRDLEGNDRDAEFARRARLRFLAIRPVRRLLDKHGTGVSRESYLAQIEAVREELGYLPARDAERARLARFLHNIEEADPLRAMTAALEMADSCAAAGQMFGAEEFALTALGLATAHSVLRMQGVANATLARIYRLRGLWAEAAQCAATAETIADAENEAADAVRARAELALTAAGRGDASAARAIMAVALNAAHAAKNAQASALAEAKLCECELALGNAEAALEHGWISLRQLDDVRDRALLLEAVGTAFSLVGLHKAAERCFTMVAQRGVDSALRARARAVLAVAAAGGDAPQLFRDRRVALLNDSAEWSADARVSAFVHLELGRGALIAGDLDFAREHVRAAITTARKHSLTDMLARAEEILTALERNAGVVTRMPIRPGLATDATRRIAEQLETLPDLPVIAN